MGETAGQLCAFEMRKGVNPNGINQTITEKYCLGGDYVLFITENPTYRLCKIKTTEQQMRRESLQFCEFGMGKGVNSNATTKTVSLRGIEYTLKPFTPNTVHTGNGRYIHTDIYDNIPT